MFKKNYDNTTSINLLVNIEWHALEALKRYGKCKGALFRARKAFFH